MKKNILLIALSLVLIATFVSCDNTGIFDAVQSTVPADDVGIYQYIGYSESKSLGYFLSTKNGLQSYNFANETPSESLLDDSMLKSNSRTFATLNSSGDKIIVFVFDSASADSYTPYFINLNDTTLSLHSIDTYDTTFVPKKSKDTYVFTTSGVYTLDITETTTTEGETSTTTYALTSNQIALHGLSDNNVQILNGMYLHYKQTEAASGEKDYVIDYIATAADPSSNNYTYTTHKVTTTTTDSDYNIAFSTNNIVAISDNHNVVMKNTSSTQYFYSVSKNSSGSNASLTHSSGYAFGRTSSDDSSIVTSNCFSASNGNYMFIAGPYCYTVLKITTDSSTNDISFSASSVTVSFKKVIDVVKDPTTSNKFVVFTENRGIRSYTVS